ncbi:MAG: hypothetical protein ACREIC_03660 [Limisphaerales bacterium]
MVEAKVDQSGNVLRVRYGGRVTAEDVRAGAAELPDLLKRFRPGFRLLGDLSTLDEMALDCVPHLKRMMDLCDAAGVSLVVRVIPDPKKDIGLNIMSLFHYRKRVRIVTCQTLAEAEQLLA